MAAYHNALHPVAASCTAAAVVPVAVVAVVAAVAVVVAEPSLLAHVLVIVIEHASAVVELGPRRRLVKLGRRLEVGGRGMRWTKRQRREWWVERWARR